VLIAVRERAPFAVVRSGDDAAIVDRDLRVLVPATGTETLPAFVLQRYLALETGSFLNDGSLKTLRDDYEAMIAAHVVPLELTFDRFGGLVATMRGGVKILFGSEEDFDKKLALVNPVLSQLVRDRRRVEAVDLRAPSTPVLVFRKP
jgi:cell division septal protein FtsQ